VAVRLGIPDLVGNGSKGVAELAEATHADENALYRLLRCLILLGIIAEPSPGFYSRTPQSEQLETGHSLHGLAVLYGEAWQIRAWEKLEESIRDGRSGVSHASGTDLWAYLEKNPACADVYNRALSGFRALNEPLANACALPKDAVVVDVGGGGGEFLRQLLASEPSLRGVLFDQQSAIDSASIARDTALDERISLVTGDFFVGVPQGGDVYVLKQVLHDREDAKACLILRRCREAMKSRAKAPDLGPSNHGSRPNCAFWSVDRPADARRPRRARTHPR
jgi:O-methyltransferase